MVFPPIKDLNGNIIHVCLVRPMIVLCQTHDGWALLELCYYNSEDKTKVDNENSRFHSSHYSTNVLWLIKDCNWTQTNKDHKRSFVA